METKKQLIQKMKDELVWQALPRRSLESCSKEYLQEMYDSAVKLKLTKKAQEQNDAVRLYLLKDMQANTYRVIALNVHDAIMGNHIHNQMKKTERILSITYDFVSVPQ